MVELIDELLGLTMPFSALRALIDMGVPQGVALALAGDGDLAVGQVDLSHRGSRFGFGGPDRRLILAVRDRGEIVDLAACSSSNENEWALRLGQADFLGVDALYDAQVAADPQAAAGGRVRSARELRLFATPMAWLRGGGDGICVLDWTPSALGALRGLGSGVTLVVEPGAKAKLDAMLKHGGLPLVAEAQAERWAA